MSNNISVTEAIQRAGRVIYGDSWIAGLTPDERDAMAQYPVGGPEPVDLEACVVVARARDRDGRAKLQHDRARHWLKSCGFSTGGGACIDWEALEDALAREFGTGAPPTALPQPTVQMKLGEMPTSPPISPPAGANIASRPAQAEDGDLSSPPSPTTSEAPVDLNKPGSTITEPPEAATPDAAPPGPKTGAKSPNAADASPIPNKPGRGGNKKVAAIAAMIKAVEDGGLTFLKLRRMKQKELNDLYPDAKRTMLQEARKQALSRLADRGHSDIAPT